VPPLPPGGLSPIAARLYSYAATQLRFLPGELVNALKLTAPEIDDALSELADLKLIQPAPGREGELASVSPEAAADLLVIPMERQVREQQRIISQVRSQMQELAIEYEAGAAHRRQLRAVEVLFDRSAARDVLQESARRCTAQAVTSRPGGGHDSGTLAETSARDEEMLAQGVTMRILYQHAARYHQPTVAYAERVTELGAEIRTIGDQLAEMTVFDLNIGIMEVNNGRHTTVLVREPNILNFMAASFDRSWVSGQPFFSPNLMELSDDISQLIVDLLVDGGSDKSIARRLGISERTCQRHVRNVMKNIGARSRFQAGYLIGAAGNFGPGPQADLAG
jgi:ATP/maltotriose-dependent transcriptional regulator MalT